MVRIVAFESSVGYLHFSKTGKTANEMRMVKRVSQNRFAMDLVSRMSG